MKKIYLHSVSLFLLFFHDSVMEPTNPARALTNWANSLNNFICVIESGKVSPVVFEHCCLIDALAN
jgi:hypothetical protein